MFHITTERPEDGPEIDALLDAAFGANRLSKVSYRFRDGIEALDELKLVARQDARLDVRLLGSLRFWPVAVGDLGVPALLLGPLAVAADRRGRGIGAALMRQGLDMATWSRHRLVLLVGDLAYYEKFGFAPVAPLGIVMPDEAPERLLYLELAPNAADGVCGEVRPTNSAARWVRPAAPDRSALAA